jgi:hypothetical protein
MFAGVVDGDALLQVVWVSILAGLGLTLAFSLAIAFAARAGQARRSGAGGTAIGWYLCTGICAVVCAVAVVLGVIAMLSK